MAPTGSIMQEEDRFIAVLLTETFNENFQPIIKADPMALLPLVNTPLLDYSLHWLQRCEVNETIIYCNAQPHGDRIKDHCNEWKKRHGMFMNITIVTSENCTSLGDAMRDLYSKSLIKKDFVLLTVDIIGNLELKNLMNIHKTTRKKDPTSVMSCIYLENKQNKKYLDNLRAINLVLNSKSGKMLSHKRPEKSSKMVLPIETIQTNLQLRILSRIEDPNICICSEIIPSLFSDNFDYATRDNLIQGIIEQEELLGYSVHAQVLSCQYATRISTFKVYQKVSEAVIRRLNFPAAPERSLSSYRVRYSFQPFLSSYWDPSAKFHKKSISDYVVIDAGTEIDPRSKIKNSVIGKLCTIKENVSVSDSFIMNNVLISQGCILDCCFIGHDVKLLPGVHLEPGTIVGPNVVLGPNLKVDRCTRIMNQPAQDPFTGKLTSSVLNPLFCGKEGKAYLYEVTDSYHLEGPVRETEWGALEKDPLNDVESDGAASSTDSDENDDNLSVEGEEEEMMSDSERAEQEFIREVNDSLLNGLKENSALDNVILEINSSRHAYAVSMDDVLLAVTKGILHVGEDILGEKLKGEDYWTAVNNGLFKFADVLRNYIKKPKDQMIVLKAIEQSAMEDQRMFTIIQKCLYELNQELEIIDDEVICFWYSKGGTTPIFPAIKKIIAKFVAWLNENEDNSEDD